MKKAKLSVLERIVKAGFEIGKYPAYAIVLGSALGCIDLPKPITASKDGRYVAFPVSDSGKIDFDPKVESRIAVIDTRSNQFYFMDGRFKSPLWLSTNGETVAFAAESEDEKQDFSSVYITSREGHQTIENASYPALSSDGNYLAFSRAYKETVKIKVPVNPPKNIPPPLVPKYPPTPAPLPQAPKPAPAAPAPMLQPAPPAPKADSSADYSPNPIHAVSMQQELLPVAPRPDPSDDSKIPAPAPIPTPQLAPTPYSQPPKIYSSELKEQTKEVMKEITRTRLFVRDLRSGLETKIDDDGIISDFSPDGSNLLYLKEKPLTPEEEITSPKSNEPDAELYVCDRDGRNKTLISNITPGRKEDDSLPLYPVWINNNEILFQTKTERTGDDTEVFIYNTKSRTLQQVTDNDVEEFLPQFKDNRIYYETQKLVDKSDPKHPKYDISFFVAEKSPDNTWLPRKLNLKPYLFAIAGNSIYYIEDEDEPVKPGPALSIPIDPRNPKQKPATSSKIYTTTLDELYREHPRITELTPTFRGR